MADFYKANIDLFAAGPGERALATIRGTKVDAVPDSELVRQFVKNKETAQVARQLFYQQPDAQEALQTWLENDLYLYAVRQDNRIDPKRAKDWMTKNTQVLGMFAGLRQNLQRMIDNESLARTAELQGQRMIVDLQQEAETVRKVATTPGAVKDTAQARIGAQTSPPPSPNVERVTALNAELRQGQTQLEEFQRYAQAKDLPHGVSPEVRRVHEANVAWREAQQRATEMAAQLDKEAASTFLGTDVDSAMTRLLRGHTTVAEKNVALRTLLSQVGDTPEAQQGVIRALWDSFLGQRAKRTPIAGTNPALIEEYGRLPSAERLTTFLQDYGGIMREVYGQDHVRDLQDIATTLKTLEGTILPVRTPGTSVSQDFRSMTQSTSTRYFLWLRRAAEFTTGYVLAGPLFGTRNYSARGLIALGTASALEGGLKLREIRMERVMQNMLFDPNVSSTMAAIWKARNRQPLPVLQARYHAMLVNLGLGAREEAVYEEQRARLTPAAAVPSPTSTSP